MHNNAKTSLLLVVIILALGIYFFDHKQPETKLEHSPSKKIKTKIQTKKSIQEMVREQHDTQKKRQTTEPVVVLETIYDADPVVDADLLIENNRFCINYLTYTKNNTIKFMDRFISILNKKQAAYYQEFFEHCKSLNKQHPEYHLSELKSLQKQKKEALASSLWGKIIKGEIDISTLSDFEISDLLKQNNLNILKQAPKYLSDYYQQVIHWDIEDVLKNHQYNYTQLIQKYAHQLYLCQMGSNCSANSTIMASMCYLNTRSCGLDYPQFIQQALSAGQQSDIALAMDYLKNIYQ